MSSNITQLEMNVYGFSHFFEQGVIFKIDNLKCVLNPKLT